MKGVATVNIPFGLDSKQIIDRWLKFRDVSLNQHNERGTREAQVAREYNMKYTLRPKYEELLKWETEKF